ncbi:uncharacterized protein LOC120115051 [Hibiscus syriacus]|uniref:uncharacterized protein LOC120115051 n=1 Tax=Hibiscus syriacus TaxID=106335 RepID=UPI0019207326|nr:uncharacterized protein LOC120115051 [Hibiscus syriacus]
MGNRNKIDFWSDFWIEKTSLKISFPRIYSIAVKKCGKIKDFGCWIQGRWAWRIDLRRRLFEWEIPLWNEFRLVLNRAVSVHQCPDSVIWSGTQDGQYIPKAFCSIVASQGTLADPVWGLVWYKFVPPKVSAFVWRAVHLRLPVMLELVKRGIICNDRCLCLFCNLEPEAVNHVLCLYAVVWRAWQRWCSVWNVNLVFPMNVKQLLEVWFAQKIRQRVRGIWRIGIFGFIWIIWIHRNKSRFKGYSYSADQIFNHALL